MEYKSLLVAICDAQQDQATIRRAARLAVAHQAHLTGLFIHEPALLQPGPGYIVAADLETEAARGQDKVTRQARKAFDDICHEEGVVEPEWRFVCGERLSVLTQHSHYADAVVMTHDRMAACLAIAGPRPVISLPAQGEPSQPADSQGHVLLCWNGSREAARAIAASMPVLQAADRVTTLIVDPERASGQVGISPGTDMALYLAHHGIQTQIQIEPRNEQGVAETLVEQARLLEADWLCLGAYGHSRLRDLVLGGVTRHILAAAPEMALLWDH